VAADIGAEQGLANQLALIRGTVRQSKKTNRIDVSIIEFCL